MVFGFDWFVVAVGVTFVVIITAVVDGFRFIVGFLGGYIIYRCRIFDVDWCF
jgi:hypothetical protein